MRQDIQFLRGWAVSIVVLQHGGLGPTAGYLGVDIFFVISGYLITRLLQRQIESGDFSFVEFYLRRAKRLLPAAFTTFALTALAAPHFLTSIPLAEFREQLLGALTFSANMVLYGQSGYFDGEAEFKPLLHIWSLSLEEQYYFLLPLLLFLVKPRFWIHLAVSALIASLGLCLYFLSRDPSFAFYALPTRAWELSIGSFVALAMWDIRTPRYCRLAFWPSLAIVVAVPFLPSTLPHPSLDAALVCIGTAIIIMNGRQFFNAYPFRVVARIGDASYSLYLAHWPVLAFLNAAYLGEAPIQARVVALTLAIGLGLGLYFLVERPVHRARFRPSALKSALALLMVGACIYSIPHVVKEATGSSETNFERLRRPNYGLAFACNQRTTFKLLPECISAPNQAPSAVLWGDSLAMHLAQGLAANAKLTFFQATRSSCPPAVGYAQFNNATPYNAEWARSCIEFNSSVLQYLTETPSIKTVILGSTFSGFLANPPWQAVVQDPRGRFAIEPITKEASLNILTNTIGALRKAGKSVVIFAPPPAGRVNPSECIERKLTGLPTFNELNCSISRTDDQRRYGKVMEILASVSSLADVEVIDPRDWLCTEQFCATITENIPLYRDLLHLSNLGSVHLGQQHDWTGLVQKKAR